MTETQRAGRYMHTFTGSKYWPLDPLPEEVNLETIAHHLSMRCRYNGATKGFYSVAEHAVYVSRLVPAWCALEGLHHDSSEAYNGDLIRPLKYSDEFARPFKKVELLNDVAVAQRFDLEFSPERGWPDPVHKADEMVTAAEVIQLIRTDPTQEWDSGKLHDHTVVAPIQIQMLDWRDAKALFLNRHKEIMDTRERDLFEHHNVRRFAVG